MLLLCSLAGFASDIRLTPAPKQLEVTSGQTAKFSYDWKIDNETDYNHAADWIEEEFSGRRWLCPTETPQKVILRKMPFSGENREKYQLEISPNGIILSAADEAGMWRAVGRLLSLLKNPGVNYHASGFEMPCLKITDWPDFPLRLMDLTMTYWEPFSDAERLESSKKIVEIMAEHGFNHVIIDLGGNYESEYFKSNRPTPWSRSDIRELVRFCKSRGIVPLPGINTIGHLDRAPHIALLRDNEGRNIGHDIRTPEFYEAYAKVLDELVELFEKPPYFLVGGDEANAVFKIFQQSKEENAALYAKVFNFAAEHLEKYNCRPVIWHDMLFAPELGGERISNDGITEKNIAPASTALNLLSKKVIVNYWHYGSAERYEGLDILTQSGFDVWASTWHFPEGIHALAQYAGKHQIAAYVGTTWNNNHNKGAALILVGEYSWNTSASPVTFDPAEVFLREWSRTPFFPNPQTVTPLHFAGAVTVPFRRFTAPVQLGNLQLESNPISGMKRQFFHLEQPEEIVTLRQERPDTKLFLQGGERFVMQVPSVNQNRAHNSFVLYTPSFGQSTRQNKWGDDWTILNGEVTQSTSGEPNSAIPQDGGVISAHKTGADIHNNVRKIMAKGKVDLIATRTALAEPIPPLKAVCDPQNSTVIMVFGAELWMYTEIPQAAAEIAISTTGGTTEKFKLNVDFALAPDPRFHGNFNIVYLPDGLVAVIWTGKNQETATGVTLQFTPLGIATGTALVAAAEMK